MRAAHDLAGLLNSHTREVSRRESTRYANEIATVVDLDPVVIHIHSNGLEFAQSSLYWAGVKPSRLREDDTLLVVAVGSEYAVVGKVRGHASTEADADLANARLTGEIIEYGGASVPDGWLLCNGAAVSRTTYADLFDVIGTDYGIGDGTTTFNLPPASLNRRIIKA